MRAFYCVLRQAPPLQLTCLPLLFSKLRPYFYPEPPKTTCMCACVCIALFSTIEPSRHSVCAYALVRHPPLPLSLCCVSQLVIHIPCTRGIYKKGDYKIYNAFIQIKRSLNLKIPSHNKCHIGHITMSTKCIKAITGYLRLIKKITSYIKYIYIVY